MVPVRVQAYGAVLAALVLVAIPAWAPVLWILRATDVAVFCVAFLGLHILSGHLGLISVGHGAFIGIGALGAAHAIDDLGVPFLLAPVVGAAVGAAFGVLIGVPSLRLPGAYLALLTLAVAMALPIAMRRIDGPLGYRVDGDIRPPDWTGLSTSQTPAWQYGLVVALAAIIITATHLAVRGRFTRALVATRDEPIAAAAFGIDVARVRLTGVALAAGLAGAAGGLSLFATPLVAGSQYPFDLSVSMFALMLALGATRPWTILPAAVTLVLLPPALVELGYAAWQPIIYAALLLVMTRVSRGEGIASLIGGLTAPRPPGTARSSSSGRRVAGNLGVEAGGDRRNPYLLTPEPPTSR